MFKKFNVFIVALLSTALSFSAWAGHVGDYAPSTVIYGKFTTYRPSTGASFTLAGSPALSVYKDNSTTQSTTGVTLTADFDSVTGLHHYAIDTSADGTFYSAGSNFDIVVTAGTVDSISIVGTVVGSFSLNKTAALKPTTAGRTLDVSAGGEAGVDWANVGSPTTTVNLSGTTISTTQAVNVAQISGDSTAADNLETAFDDTAGSVVWQGILDQGTAQAATGTTLQLRSAAAFGDDTLNGASVVVCGSTQGYCQANLISDYVSATDTATLLNTWAVTPSGTITYKVWGTAAGASGSLTAADVWAYSARTLTALDEDSTTLDLNGTAVGSVTSLGNGSGFTAIPWNAAWDAEVQSEATDALNATTLTEPAAKPSWGSSSIAQWIAWLGAWSRNEINQTSTAKKLRNDADNADIVSCAVSDNGTTFEVSECSP